MQALRMHRAVNSNFNKSDPDCAGSLPTPALSWQTRNVISFFNMTFVKKTLTGEKKKEAARSAMP